MKSARTATHWFLAGVLTTALTGLALTLVLTGTLRGEKGQSDPPRPIVHIRNQQDAIAAREALVAFLFGQSALPETRPEPATDGMIVRMQNGITSAIIRYAPEKPNGALVIYHSGHEGFTLRDRAAIQTYSEAGYAVWRLDLPLLGANPPQIQLAIPEAGPVTFREHSQFAYLDEVTDGSPLRYFVEPAVAAVNQAVADGYEDIYMSGLSGGGWVTMLAAAADARIDASYPIAPGAPLALRFGGPPRDWGEWEENLPALQRIAGFEDLSVLGAAGRSQIQVFNQYDLCCYNDSRYLAYESELSAAAGALGGRFAIHWSRGEILHRANPAALRAILADMQSRRSP